MDINSISINLHCGCSREVVNKQISDLKGLEERYGVDWNLRIDRYPKAYPSYSQLMNHAIATSKHEWMIFVNDRCKVSESETVRILELLQSGYACVMFYNVAYMGFSKELVRKIGFWDSRFLLGGFENARLTKENEQLVRDMHRIDSARQSAISQCAALAEEIEGLNEDVKSLKAALSEVHDD